MKNRVHYREMGRNLSADEEAMRLDNGHPIGCAAMIEVMVLDALVRAARSS